MKISGFVDLDTVDALEYVAQERYYYELLSYEGLNCFVPITTILISQSEL